MKLDNLVEFLRTLLQVSRHQGRNDAFDVHSMLVDMGFEHWGHSRELIGLWDHYFSENVAAGLRAYAERMKADGLVEDDAEHDRIAATAESVTHLVCAHRLGAAFKIALKTYYKDQYEVLPAKAPGRFGGKTQYKWK